MADNEKTVKLREAEIQMEVGKREEEARAAALIQKAKEEQKVMKERRQKGEEVAHRRIARVCCSDLRPAL